MTRRFHAYCAGTGLSGTHSIAGMLSSGFCSEHEPNKEELMSMVLGLQQGSLSRRDFNARVVAMEERGQLEMNASFLNNWLVDLLAAKYPQAKFILTIRDCYSWLNSMLYDAYITPHNTGEGEGLKPRGILKPGGMYGFIKQDSVFYEGQAAHVDGLLAYWANVNNRILAAVPGSRLLVVRTNEISRKGEDIADFLGISVSDLDATKMHLGKSNRSFNILSKLDRKELDAKIDARCKDLMDRFFPGFTYDLD